MAAVATLEDYGSDVPEVDSNPLGVYYVAILYPIKAYSTKRCAIDIIKFCGFSFTPTRTGTLPHIPVYHGMPYFSYAYAKHYSCHLCFYS